MTRKKPNTWFRLPVVGGRDVQSVSSNTNTPSVTSLESDMSIEKPIARHDASDFTLQIHPVPEYDEVLISVSPPKEPSASVKHIPCDITLVIDVSGSMNREATVPIEGLSEQDRTGLTILDLTKHAARTILQTLDEGDRLGIVTFSNDAETVQTLLPMTPKNKKETWDRINKLRPQSSTNLWHGILSGMKLYDNEKRAGVAPAIMVLTDGEPNYMCPKQGYVPKLRTYDIPVPIHTFGFGYSIRSALLKSIAEIGGGNYAFIPDAGMIGTIFIHAIANLQSTFATSAKLEVSVSAGLTLIETVGEYIRKEEATNSETNTLSIPLHNLQYGQTRDVLLKYKQCSPTLNEKPALQAILTCTPLDDAPAALQQSCNLHDSTGLPAEVAHYHRSRSQICSFLSSITPISTQGERVPIPSTSLGSKRQDLDALITSLHSLQLEDDLNKSLLEDLAGTDPSGQVSLSLSTSEYFYRWGIHFLPSLMNAHMQQICNSFKDPGPLQYGSKSPLFVKCRDLLDHAFDNLPAPKPSVTVKDRQGNVKNVRVAMKEYNNRYGGCWAADCLVRMADGTRVRSTILRGGMQVWTPKGSRTIKAVISSSVTEQMMCVIGEKKDLVITPWHPVSVSGGWSFPATLNGEQTSYSGDIISLLLEKDDDSAAHAVEVSGQLVVTLGHGVTGAATESDVRGHAFFGSHETVSKGLDGLPSRESGVVLTNGMKLDEKSGLVSGFVWYAAAC